MELARKKAWLELACGDRQSFGHLTDREAPSHSCQPAHRTHLSCTTPHQSIISIHHPSRRNEMPLPSCSPALIANNKLGFEIRSVGPPQPSMSKQFSGIAIEHKTRPHAFGGAARCGHIPPMEPRLAFPAGAEENWLDSVSRSTRPVPTDNRQVRR